MQPQILPEFFLWHESTRRGILYNLLSVLTNSVQVFLWQKKIYTENLKGLYHPSFPPPPRVLKQVKMWQSCSAGGGEYITREVLKMIVENMASICSQGNFLESGRHLAGPARLGQTFSPATVWIKHTWFLLSNLQWQTVSYPQSSLSFFYSNINTASTFSWGIVAPHDKD